MTSYSFLRDDMYTGVVDLTSEEIIEKVICSYGQTLELHASIAGKMIAEKFLPYKRNIIRICIEKAIYLNPKHPMNGMLGASYIKTCYYRLDLPVDVAGVGEIEFDKRVGDLNSDISYHISRIKTLMK